MKKNIGLVLSGGGIRGSYQIGAFYALKKSGIKFNAIVGTSIGSFNAAMLAAHEERKLLKFWQNINVNNFLELDPILQDKKISFEKLTATVKTIAAKLQNKGFNVDPLRIELNNLLNEKKLRRSKINFGLVTLKGNDTKPVKIFLKDMAFGKVIDYILASCYLPIFKQEKMIDDDYYLDGGFSSNCPVEMLEEFNCDEIYAVNLNAIGVVKHSKAKVTWIKPSVDLGSILATDPVLINNNIKLGYNDTLKVLNKLDGREYSFIKKSKNYYARIIKRIKPELLRRAELHYKTKNPKKLIIRILEYILRSEKKDIYHIYKPRDIIKSIKKQRNKRNFQYEFVSKLKVRM